MTGDTAVFVAVHLAVSQAEMALRVLEERLDVPPVGWEDHMLGWSVDSVRDEVLDGVIPGIFGGHFMSVASTTFPNRERGSFFVKT